MAIDPLSLIVAAGATKVAADLATDAFKEIQKPLLEHLGQKLRDRVLNRTAPVLAQTHKLLEGTGKAVTDVPDRMLIPILERAALNDDADIAKKWTHLLASAAVRLDEVYPAYIDILASLSPAEAAMLDQYWTNVLQKSHGSPRACRFLVSFSPDQTTYRMEADRTVPVKTPAPKFAFGAFRVTPPQAEIFAGNFVRLGLWSTEPINQPVTEDKVHEIVDGKIDFQTLGRYVTDHPGIRKFIPSEPEAMRQYRFTSLGAGLMTVCHGTDTFEKARGKL
jgi:hypothetical protein